MSCDRPVTGPDRNVRREFAHRVYQHRRARTNFERDLLTIWDRWLTDDQRRAILRRSGLDEAW